jgi:Zn-dependent membrane protease YugP
MLELFEEFAEYYDLADYYGHYLGSLVFLLLVPPFVFAAWAKWRFKKTFDGYAQVPAGNGLTGLTAAQCLLDQAGIRDVRIVATRSLLLSDHYNPLTKELALSEAVYHQSTLAAVGIAAHEVGHAVQHANRYFWLWLRTALVPLTKVCCVLGIGVTLYGVLAASPLMWAGVVIFAGGLLFPVVTLPVEFDASARARRLAVAAGIIQPAEEPGMRRVLRAAALTYVAQTFSTCVLFLLLVAYLYLHPAGAEEEFIYDP